MTYITPTQLATGVSTGPLNHDPLTEGELALLLAIPRGAEKTPNATAFRLPMGPDPSQGWVDVTFSEARSIIAHLALDWKSRLSKREEGLVVGPGLTICLLVQPVIHALFHWFGFWALGCSIQVISLTMDDDTIALYLSKSKCRVVIHSGIGDERVERISSACDAAIIRLPKEEYSHQLALDSRQKQSELIPWPEAQRPDPALILHSSGSTGTAKLLQFSLYFYAISLPNAQSVHPPNLKNGIVNSRPFLIFSPPYWQSFTTLLLSQLVAGIPTTFARVPDLSKLPSSHFMGWAKGLDIGGVVCASRFIRDVLASSSEDDIVFLQSLYNITVTGSALGRSTAALAGKYRLNFINIFGCTELGALLLTNQLPYTHLRLLPGPSPVVLPISDPEPDGSQQVQIWYPLSTSTRAAHLHAKGGIPLRFEPFPGEGPHMGKPAVKLDDIFKEVRNTSETGPQVSYVHVGRSDDLIKLAGNGGWDINASAYEAELTSAIISYLAGEKADQWTFDGVQLFGNDRPCTALAIQLRSVHQNESTGEIGQDVLGYLSNMVERVNTKLKLDSIQRVDPHKRMLVIVSGGKAYGSGANAGGEMPRLMLTHKHTLQRWRNVEAFGNWLDGLDYGLL